MLIQIPLGVIPKNETKIDEMIAILTELQKYVPQQQSSDSIV